MSVRYLFRSSQPASFSAEAFVTNLVIDSTSASTQTNVPITFGQVFAVGDVPASSTLTGYRSGVPLAIQVNKKATHPDGSLRHAVISTVIPTLSASASTTLDLYTTANTTAPAATSPGALLASGFAASLRVTIGGNLYTASANALLSSGPYTTWLSGPIANEWHVAAPVANAGSDHPHLVARFAIRAFADARARVDVTLENGWAYEPSPSNFSFDTAIVIGATTAYAATAMTQFDHTRWRKVFWWGTIPGTHERHNVAYLIATKAVPNYDPSVSVAEATISAMDAAWTGSKIEPMGAGQAHTYMPDVGGRPDIGILPAWTTQYLLSQDKRLKKIMLGTADLAGSWGMHYRDQLTDRPLSVIDWPYSTLAGTFGDTFNPGTGLHEAFPTCSNCAGNPNVEDNAHQPSLAFLPYIVTGDYYYLEELQFWCMYNIFLMNPGYRQQDLGLFQQNQVRAQGWCLRTLAQAAYITPDNDDFKAQFAYWIGTNLDYYDSAYITSPTRPNSLGIFSHASAFGYLGGTGIAPWQEDFVTQSVGYMIELGFTDAAPFFAWKAQFPILRMTGGSGYCWIQGAAYQLKVRDTTASAADNISVYATIAQVANATFSASFNAIACASQAMADHLQPVYPGIDAGEMTGYSSLGTGYPSNMQPALAYAATYAVSGAATAWTQFMARTVKPDYGPGPQFAIIPRT